MVVMPKCFNTNTYALGALSPSLLFVRFVSMKFSNITTESLSSFSPIFPCLLVPCSFAKTFSWIYSIEFGTSAFLLRIRVLFVVDITWLLLDASFNSLINMAVIYLKIHRGICTIMCNGISNYLVIVESENVSLDVIEDGLRWNGNRKSTFNEWEGTRSCFFPII